MKTKFLVLILPLAFLLSSCLRSSYQYVSYKEPGLPVKIYKKVCVFADLSDPFAKQEMELFVGRRLFEQGMNAIPAYTVIPPTRERTNEEIHDILVSNSFDAFIKISYENVREMTGYVPEETTSTTVVKERVVKDKHKCDEDHEKESSQSRKHKDKDVKKKVTTEETTVTSRPGYSYHYTLGSLNVRMIDIESSQVAFVQNIHSGGYEPQFRMTSLRNREVQMAVGETVVDGLIREGFLPRLD